MQVEGGGHKKTLYDEGFFETFGFIDPNTKIGRTSTGQLTMVVYGLPEFIGNWTITQIYQEIMTPQLYGVNIEFTLEILKDSSSDASIAEEAKKAIEDKIKAD